MAKRYSPAPAGARGAQKADVGAGSRARDGIGLRALARAGTAVLGTIALVLCGTLIILTTLLTRGSLDAMHAAQRLRAVETARVDILMYGRMSDLAYLTRDDRHELERTQAEAELLARVADVRSKAASNEERELAERCERDVHAYLSARSHAERDGGPLQQVMEKVNPARDVALDGMSKLATIQLGVVQRADGRAEHLDNLANVIGVTAALIMLAGFVGIVVGLNRFVLSPLFSLSEAIRRFAAGERSTRLAPRGTAELVQTADSFNDMARRLERQQETLLTFIAGVAHDLRNPLSALRLALPRLDPSRPAPPGDQVPRTFQLVSRQVDRLDRMVGDLLEAARVESGQLDLSVRPTDVCELAHDAVDLYRPSSLSHELVLHTPECPLMVSCDGERIEQVVGNLVSNAIKYSPGGGLVEITVAREGGEATIAVTDHGMGIAPEERKRIFEPFRRARVSRDAAPGTGLGLSVSRRIVEAHGGSIEVESTVGVGSTFRVRLPIEPAVTSSPSRHDARATS